MAGPAMLRLAAMASLLFMAGASGAAAEPVKGVWRSGPCFAGAKVNCLEFDFASARDTAAGPLDGIRFECLFANVIGMYLGLRPPLNFVGETAFTIWGDVDEADKTKVIVQDRFASGGTSFWGKDEITEVQFPVTPGYEGYDRDIVHDVLDTIGRADRSVFVAWNGGVAEIDARGSTNAVKKFRARCDRLTE